MPTPVPHGVSRGPEWFDWLSLTITVVVGVVPVLITLGLWRADHRSAARRSVNDQRAAAARAMLDRARRLTRADLEAFDSPQSAAQSLFAVELWDVRVAYGAGAWPLISMVERWIQMTIDDVWSTFSSVTTKDRAIVERATYELSRIFSSWRDTAGFREVAYRNGVLTQFHAEFGGPGTLKPELFIEYAEDFLLLNTNTHEWLIGTAFAPRALRARRRARRRQVQWIRWRSKAAVTRLAHPVLRLLRRESRTRVGSD